MNTHMKGWPNMKYLTYMQANQLGGRIRKGEKSVSIVFTSFKEVGEEKKLVPFVKRHSVFNLAQTEGIQLPEPEPLPESERLSRVNRIVAASGIEVRHGDYSPCYRPGQDMVLMPHFSAFVGEHAEEEYASTMFHELTHAIGHPSRLDRKFSSKIFKENYGQEELVAELGAAFCCARTGYDYSAAQSPAYIDHWLKVLKADNRAIFSLASYASHSCDWLMQKEQEAQLEPEEEPDEELSPSL
jgi:antirestriction protein ArdC